MIWHFGSYSDPVECKNVVPPAQIGMKKSRTGNNRPVVTKHTDFGLDGNTKISQGLPRVYSLFGSCLAATNL